jgi:hypothetical protein
MHSDLIGKIAKARQYAQEPERIQLHNLQATFKGGNNDHTISLDHDQWTCDCSFFRMWQTCAHVMAFQQIFRPMISQAAREAGSPVAVEEEIIGAMS